jgi:hypothetical protein
MNKALIVSIAIISISISAQIGFAATTLTGSQTGPIISVGPPYIDVSHGDTFTVNITVDPGGNEISGVDYIISFNNTLLDATLLTRGTFFDGFTTDDTYGDGIDDVTGKIDYGELIWPYTGTGVINSGTVTTITFQAIGERGVSELYFKTVALSDPDGIKFSNAAIYSGRVGVAQPSTPFLIRGYVSYNNGSGCSDPVVNITNLNIGKEWTAKTNETSNQYQTTLSSCGDVIAGDILQFDATSPDGKQSSVTEHTVTQDEVDDGGFEYNITLKVCPGDVNGDGIITSADAAIVLQMAVRGESSIIADVNHDDTVTSLEQR